MWFQSYHNYDDTKSFYVKLASQYSSVVDYIPSIGKTSQERDIFAVRIGNHLDSSLKKVVYIQG